MNTRRPAAVALAAALLATPASATAASATSEEPGSGGIESKPDAGTEPDAPSSVSLTDDAGHPTDIGIDGVEALDSDDDADDGSSPDARRQPNSGPSTDGADPDQDPDAADDLAVLTEPMATDRFVVAALTWDDDHQLADDAEIFLRVLEDAGWSEWLEVGPDDGLGAGTGGTDPFITGGATAVQVQVTGEAATLPAGLDLVLVPAEPGGAAVEMTDPAPPDELPEEDPTAGSSGDTSRAPSPDDSDTDEPETRDGGPDARTRATTSGVAEPPIIRRSGWGADPSLLDWSPRYAPLRAAVIHHTAGTNNYTQNQSAGIVRGIYYYHAVTRNWGDIGYNFLVDKYGQIFLGRKGTLASKPGTIVTAGHARGFNEGTLGLSAMGDYTSVRAPQIILDRMNDLIAWQFARAGIDPNSRSGMTSPGTAARPAGQNLPRIFGHRDVGNTTCPGNNIYNRLSDMITQVANRMPPSTFILANGSRSPSRDIVGSDTRPAAEVYFGDWDGNGTETPMYRQGNRFEVYNRHDTSAAPSRALIFGKPSDDVVVGDWNANGRDSLGARRGHVWLLSDSLSSGADRAFVFGRDSDTPMAGDWDGDGRDGIGVRRNSVWLTSNSLDSGADHKFQFARTDDTLIVGDWNGNGRDTVGVRRGRTQLLTNSLTQGADWAYTYGRQSDTAIVGDWNGDGSSTIGVRRDW